MDTVYAISLRYSLIGKATTFEVQMNCSIETAIVCVKMCYMFKTREGQLCSIALFGFRRPNSLRKFVLGKFILLEKINKYHYI